ncbi:MAG TPA: hypothetical protein VFG22_02020 [Polyangiales bacterium]|nr:hypothetical protein [Polyangiales bacterium]
MNDLLKAFSGSKTYILALAGIALLMWGNSAPESWIGLHLDQILAALGFGTAAALRAGVQKIGVR